MPPLRWRIVWAAALVLWAMTAAQVINTSPQLSSDDALFFLRGLSRFSVLDLSPQFPGYPGFIVMGRGMGALTQIKLQALGAVTLSVALALPWVAAVVAWRIAGQAAAALALLLVTFQPLLPNLALNLLSDGAGILFVVSGIALLPDPSNPRPRRLATLAGLAFGWALACRPTNLIFAGAAALGATAGSPRQNWTVWLGMALVLVPTAAVLLLTQPYYVAEGLRFVQGHAQIWGNTALGDGAGISWFDSLLTAPLVFALLIIGACSVVTLAWRSGLPGRALRLAILGGFIGHAVWIFWFQNPENLRHVAPLIILGSMAFAVLSAKVRLVRAPYAVMLAACLAIQWPLPFAAYEHPAPLQAVIKAIAAEDREKPLIITNHGVELLRQSLPGVRVYDAYYHGSATLAASLATVPVWRITSTPCLQPNQVFAARHLGERTLYVCDGT